MNLPVEVPEIIRQITKSDLQTDSKKKGDRDRNNDNDACELVEGVAKTKHQCTDDEKSTAVSRDNPSLSDSICKLNIQSNQNKQRIATRQLKTNKQSNLNQSEAMNLWLNHYNFKKVEDTSARLHVNNVKHGTDLDPNVDQSNIKTYIYTVDDVREALEAVRTKINVVKDIIQPRPRQKSNNKLKTNNRSNLRNRSLLYDRLILRRPIHPQTYDFNKSQHTGSPQLSAKNENHNQQEVFNQRELLPKSDNNPLVNLIQVTDNIHSQDEKAWSASKPANVAVNQTVNQHGAINSLEPGSGSRQISLTVSKPHQAISLSQVPSRDGSDPPVYVSTINDIHRSLEVVTEKEKVSNNCSNAEDIRKPSLEVMRPKIPKTTSNDQQKPIVREQHLYNMIVILNNTNATLIRSQENSFYTCFFCLQYYQNALDLKEHNLNMHTNIEQCNLYLKEYSVSNLDVTGLQCTLCNCRILVKDTLDSLVNHLNEFHSMNLLLDVKHQILPVRFYDNQPQCCVCSKIFNVLGIMLLHVQKHFRTYVCSVCNLGFIRRENFLKHTWTHAVQDLSCRYCPKQFLEEDERDRHENIVHCNNVSLMCGYCGEKFSHVRQKELHVTLFHNDQYQPPKRDVVFQSKQAPSADLMDTDQKKIDNGTVLSSTVNNIIIENKENASCSPIQTPEKLEQMKKTIDDKKRDPTFMHNHIERLKFVKFTNVILIKPVIVSAEYKNDTIDLTSNKVDTEIKIANSINKCIGAQNQYEIETNNCHDTMNTCIKQENSNIESTNNDFENYEYRTVEAIKSESASLIHTPQTNESAYQGVLEESGVDNKSKVTENIHQIVIKDIEMSERMEQNLDEQVKISNNELSKLTIDDKHIYDITNEDVSATYCKKVPALKISKYSQTPDTFMKQHKKEKVQENPITNAADIDLRNDSTVPVNTSVEAGNSDDERNKYQSWDKITIASDEESICAEQCGTLSRQVSVHTPDMVFKKDLEEIDEDSCSTGELQIVDVKYDCDEAMATEEASLDSNADLNLIGIDQKDVKKNLETLSYPADIGTKTEVKPLETLSVSSESHQIELVTTMSESVNDKIKETDTATLTSTIDNPLKVLVTITTKDRANIDERDESASCRINTKYSDRLTMKAKNLHNLTIILNSTNATLVKVQDDAGYKCFWCADHFLDPSELKYHNLQMHKNIEQRYFTYISDFIAKMDITGLRCNICNEQIDVLETLIKHFNVIHAMDLYSDVGNQIMAFRFKDNMAECSVCCKSFKKLRTLSVHMRSHYSNYYCQFCKAGFISIHRLRAHESNHYIGIYTCHLCNKEFDTKRKVQCHERRVHSFRLGGSCNYCSEKFDNVKQKESHLKWVHNIRVNSVIPLHGGQELISQKTQGEVEENPTINLLSYQDKHYLNMNLLLTCTNATLIYSEEIFGFMCYFCCTYYKSPMLLKRHALKMHTVIPKTEIYRNYHIREIAKLDITDLCCKLCSNRFYTLEKVIEHLKAVHNKIFFVEMEPLKMPIRFNNGTPQCCYCQEEFTSYGNLIKHLKIHFRNYICDVCDSGFVSKKQLIYHIKSNDAVHGKFKCCICFVQFNTYSKRKEHEDIAHSVWYPCEFCEKLYNSRTAEKQHSLNCHKKKCLKSPKEPLNEISRKECVKDKNTFGTRTREILRVPEVPCKRKCPENVPNSISKQEAISESSNEKPIIEIILKYENDNQSVDNNTEMAQNENCEPSKLTMDTSQKCHTCNMEFMTWDALSVHIKECSSFANSFLGEDDETNEIEDNDVDAVPELENKNGVVVKEEENTDELQISLADKDYRIKDKYFYNLKIILECTNATMYKEQRQREFGCYFCENNYTSPADLKKHNTSTHTTINREDLKIPIERRKVLASLDTTDLKCKLCNMPLKNLMESTSHMKQLHQKELDPEIINQILAFKLHEPVEKENGKRYNFTCELCHKDFTTKTSLKFHGKSHGQFTNDCDNVTSECDKLSSENEKRTIKSNKRLANNIERNHKCNVCNNMFATAKSMKSHMNRIHLMKRTHFCTECNKGFFFISELNIHKTTHTRIPAFKCEICNNSYMRKNYYAEHMRIHEKDRLYKCANCNKSFTCTKSIRNHKKVCTTLRR